MTSSQNQDSTEGFVILIVFRPTGNLTSDSCSSSDCDFWLPNARPCPWHRFEERTGQDFAQFVAGLVRKNWNLWAQAHRQAEKLRLLMFGILKSLTKTVNSKIFANWLSLLCSERRESATKRHRNFAKTFTHHNLEWPKTGLFPWTLRLKDWKTHERVFKVF